MKFADWFHCFHKMEPLRPQKPAEDAQFTQKVTYEHHLNQYDTEFKKWKASIEDLTKVWGGYSRFHFIVYEYDWS